MNRGENDPSTAQRTETLYRAALEGDQGAEKQLFEHLTVRFRYLAKRYAVEADAEDLVQETCTTIFEKYRSEKFSVSFGAWAYGVLRMKIGNYLQQNKRTRQREGNMPETVADPHTDGAGSRLRRNLLDCLSSLIESKPRYARILNLSHQGFTTEQICDRLEMNANQYYVALNRSRSLLKACLQGKGIDL